MRAQKDQVNVQIQYDIEADNYAKNLADLLKISKKMQQVV